MLSCELLSNHRCQVLPDKKVVNAGTPEKCQSGTGISFGTGNQPSTASVQHRHSRISDQLYRWSRLVELAIPSAGAEMLSCELLSNHRCQVLPDKKVVNAGTPEKSQSGTGISFGTGNQPSTASVQHRHSRISDQLYRWSRNSSILPSYAFYRPNP